MVATLPLRQYFQPRGRSWYETYQATLFSCSSAVSLHLGHSQLEVLQSVRAKTVCIVYGSTLQEEKKIRTGWPRSHLLQGLLHLCLVLLRIYQSPQMFPWGLKGQCIA